MTPCDPEMPRETAERERLLRSFDILDTPREPDFDDIVGFAAKLCEAPIALISLVAGDRQWFKAETGLGRRETPIEQAFCLHALNHADLLEIPDTARDARTARNPLVTGEPHVRFYAGAPLRPEGGPAIGTLCVLDRVPRELSELQREGLRILARQVVKQLELRRALNAQRHLQGEIDHRVKNSLQMVMAYLRLQRRRVGDEAAWALEEAEHRIGAISMLHAALHEAGEARSVELSAFLGKIATLLSETLPDRVCLHVEVAPLRLSAGRAAAIGQIANEFVANSAKHAFPEGRIGEIRIVGAARGTGYALTLSDDGVGFAEPQSHGLGLTIIETAAQQLGAALDRATEGPGTRITLAFAAEEDAASLGPVRQAV